MERRVHYLREQGLLELSLSGNVFTPGAEIRARFGDATAAFIFPAFVFGNVNDPGDTLQGDMRNLGNVYELRYSTRKRTKRI